MKNLLNFTLLLLAFLLPATATAHDFEVNGIFYNLLSYKEVAVTYKGTSYYEYSNEYSGDVTIPSTVTYNGATYSVITIGRCAFYDCSCLTSVTIPNSVTSFGDSAFYGCSGLTGVTIGNSVTYIDHATFWGCSGLTTVTIPNSVTSIGEGAFKECTGLTSVTIGNSVTNIGCWAFSDCTSLTSVTIGNSVTSIYMAAFGCCSGLTSVTCLATSPPTSDGAFLSEEISRATLYVPDKSVSAYQSAYNWMDFSQIVGITVTPASDEFEVDGVWYRALDEITAKVIQRPGLEDYYQGDVVIPESVTYNSTTYSVTAIDYCAFQECRGLTSVAIGNSVTSIGFRAFRDCSGLTSVSIPNSVTSIGTYAFDGCSGLTSVTCLATKPPTIASSYGSSYGAFPSEVTSQATLYVPDKSVSAYQSTYNWKNFSRIVGISVTPAIDEFEMDGVWYRAQDENTAMVIRRPGVEDYYQGDVVIPVMVTYEDNTFTVVSIDVGAFEDCYDLTSVVIGDALESIGESAFQGCTALTSVTIGSGVTAIGAKAFNYCNALQTVTCHGMVPPVMASSNCFTNAAYMRATLRVPRNAQADYCTSDYWFKFNQVKGFGSAGLGDVDGDGVIGIADVTAMIDYRLYGKTDNEFYFESADMNGNGRIDIADISTLIDVMLFVEN